MVKPVKRPQVKQQPAPLVESRICSLFSETLVQFVGLRKKFDEFRETKLANPLQRFGTHDTPFKGILGKSVPGLWHAHLNNDISIVYRIQGKGPTYLYMYGFFTHKALGTGNPPDIGVQRNMAKQFSNQTFPEKKPNPNG
jgi:hypothetical protein